MQPNRSLETKFDSNSEGCSEEARSRWQHEHMLREDYAGLFYRKLNLIIMLEESEQAYHQREILMISHRDHPSHLQHDIHPVTFLTKHYVKQHQNLKAEMRLRKQEAELRVEISKLDIDKKCLLEEIAIFASKISDIAQEVIQEGACCQAEALLLDHGKKYNLSTTILAFIKEAKTITLSHIVSDCLRACLRQVNLGSSKPLRLEDLKMAHHSRSKRELLDHITLYLKQFRSSAIFKELSEQLNSLITLYDRLSLTSHYLYNKLAQEIHSNLEALARVNKELDELGNRVKDYRIEIEILVEEIKISEREMKELELKSSQCIAEEAAFLSKEYESFKTQRQTDESFSLSCPRPETEPQGDFLSYFQEELKQKYQQFVKNQLEDAEHIRILKEKIEDQTLNLQRLKSFYQLNATPPRSELQTHRTLEESVFSEFQHPLREAQLNPSRNAQASKQPSLRQSAKKSTFTSQLEPRKEVFLVKKIFKISNTHRQSVGSQPQREKTYELKLTKKHLIMQEQTRNTLQFNEKVEIDHIKGYRLEEDQHLLSLDCGHNSLKLQFLSANTATFIAKLDKLNKLPKQNHVPSRH